jgi:transposase
MKKTEKMSIINPNAAGIDIGSRSHFVAVGQNEEDVMEFGVYSCDHQAMIQHLKRAHVKTIAMESTGSYWQSLFLALIQAGFEVILVAGQQTKNVRAKTDVKDCQWIQKLHSLGLLRGCFLPSEETGRLRTLNRHRSSLIEESSKMINKMQKAMRLMNLRLDVVLSDITGKSGIKIIEAILKGERSGEILSRLADNRVRKGKEEIANALQGNWNDELLFELSDCYDIFKMLQNKIQGCDQKVLLLLNQYTKNTGTTGNEKSLVKKQLKGKNQQRFNLTEISNNFYGVDLFAIEGVSTNTVMTLISEVGQDIYKFETAKHFTSWLRLAPNNRISGGKVISSKTPKGANKLALTLRNAANSIDRIKKGSLVSFFKRIAYKKGRAAAITATARKLATIIWTMVIRKEEYKPMEEGLYNAILKAKNIFLIKQKMKKMNISMSDISVA